MASKHSKTSLTGLIDMFRCTATNVLSPSHGVAATRTGSGVTRLEVRHCKYCNALYCTELYCTVQYCNALYCR